MGRPCSSRNTTEQMYMVSGRKGAAAAMQRACCTGVSVCMPRTAAGQHRRQLTKDVFDQRNVASANEALVLQCNASALHAW